MPVYEYRCTSCGKEFEYQQRMSDPDKTTCEACGKEALERLISRTAFQLKGSGWYKDLYSSSKPSGDSKPASSDSGSTPSTDSSSPKSDSAPSSTPASTPSTSGSGSGSSGSGGSGSGGSSGSGGGSSSTKAASPST